MKKIVQFLNSGKTSIINIPPPIVGKNEVLIRTIKSLISIGTEKNLIEFSKSNIFQKAKKEPDKLQKVIKDVLNNGLFPTYNYVNLKLSEPYPLGYCNIGEVIQIGSKVKNIKNGDIVVSNGSHSELNAVNQNLCCSVPKNVSFEDAVFTVLASISLNAIRLTNAEIGNKVLVIGSGLVGLITSKLLIAAGCNPFMLDNNEDRVKIAKNLGFKACNTNDEFKDEANYITANHGFDSTLICTSTKKNDPIEIAQDLTRKKGKIILIGQSGLNLSRNKFYFKELSFGVSLSYGPGRYDKNYENKSLDYPIEYVRFTENRNFESILNLLANNQVKFNDLITHSIPFDDYNKAYNDLDNKNKLAVILEYSNKNNADNISKLDLKNKNKKIDTKIIIGSIGSSNYANKFIFPNLKGKNITLKTIVSKNGLTGFNAFKKYKFVDQASNADFIINDKEINTVFISSLHNLHSSFVIKSIINNKNIYVDKPLAINIDELNKIKDLLKTYQKTIQIGFNRRYSRFSKIIRKEIIKSKKPKFFNYNINAGYLANDSWIKDKEISGGRIIGEICHFIDLIIYLSGDTVTSYSIKKFGSDIDLSYSISLELTNNSFANINYYTNGSNKYIKERLEVSSNKKNIILKDFKKLFVYDNKKRSYSNFIQDKGNKACINNFLDNINNGCQDYTIYDSILATEIAINLENL